MVILGWILDKPLALLFDPFESVVCTPYRARLFVSLIAYFSRQVLYISVHTMGYVVADGKSNWLEGVILVCLLSYPLSSFSLSG